MKFKFDSIHSIVLSFLVTIALCVFTSENIVNKFKSNIEQDRIEADESRKNVSRNLFVVKLKNRFATLPKSIFGLFLVFIILAFITEYSRILQSKFKNNVFVILINKISYAIIASLVFYFIMIHYPKEELRVDNYRFVNNAAANIWNEIELIFHDLVVNYPEHKVSSTAITFEDIEGFGSKVDPNKPIKINFPSQRVFNSWFDYISFRRSRILKSTNDLLRVSRILDDELLKAITEIDNLFNEPGLLNGMKFGNGSLKFGIRSFWELLIRREDVINIIMKKYRIFDYEHKRKDPYQDLFKRTINLNYST